MATAKKTAPAKKSAKPSTVAESGMVKDPNHPEISPERHKGNAQEAPTNGGAATADQAKTSGANAGTHQAEFAPNPSIGVSYDNAGGVESAGTAIVDGEELASHDHVFTLEQALSLPVLEDGAKGKPVKAPAKGSKAEKDMNGATPILSFKDARRRTMVVVSTKDGLAAMPA